MDKIQIEGLNAKQRALADIIWAFQSREGVSQFIQSLTQKDRRDAEVVLEMMIAAFTDTVDHVSDETKALLRKYNN